MAAVVNAADARRAMGNALRRELRFLRGSPADLALITVFPLLLLAILAWLLASAVIRELPIAVVDLDRSAASRSLLRHLDASPNLSVALQPDTLEDAWSAVRSLHVYAVVLVPDGMARDQEKLGTGTVFGYYNASYLTAGQGSARDIAEAVAAFNRRATQEQVALRSGPAIVRAPPVAVHASILFNAPRSFERFLLGILFPAILSLVACLAMTGALGREVRDGSLVAWLSDSGHPAAALVGKLVPYIAIFAFHGVMGLAYLAQAGAGGIDGSAWMLVAGQCLLYAACAGIALLFVGATRDMGTSLSLVGLYVGTAMAFSAATFPVVDAPVFTRAWSALLPLTAYIQLQAEQAYAGVPPAESLWPMVRLLLFCLVPGGIGAWLLAHRTIEEPVPGP
ncbi:ABC transporter permease [Pseudoxanthomonas putridarboris]|uniref:ABC transporter permease n=1 Tax=Pseudoxanthomonas putridarboris TaxID=752605 RepID=A0ABU9J270_9GAMM